MCFEMSSFLIFGCLAHCMWQKSAYRLNKGNSVDPCNKMWLLSCCLDKKQFSTVQLLSHVQLFVTPWTVARQDSLSITNSQSLIKLRSIELKMPSNHLILCHLLLLLPSLFPSISLFQWVHSSYQVGKVLELQLQHQSFQWIFRIHFL